MSEKKSIGKFLIAGILVVKSPMKNGRLHPSKDGRDYLIHCMPLDLDWEMFDADYNYLAEQDRAIGVIPAPPNTYRVMGFYEDESYDLGYEIPGATYTPNWEDKLDEHIATAEKLKGVKKETA